MSLRTANLTDDPLTAISFRGGGLIDGSGAVPADRRGAAYVLLGPAPALPGGLDPHQSVDSGFLLAATQPGYLPVSVVAQTPDSYATSSVELQILPRPATLLDYALLAAGAWNDVAAAAQTKISGQLAKLHKRLLGGIPKWMRRGRTSATDAALGEMFNVPPAALRFLPSRRKTRTDVFKAFVRGQYDGGRDALKGALKDGGDALYKVGEAEVFAFQYWTDTLVDEQGMPTRLDMGLELADVAKDVYADLKRKGADADALVMRLGRAATDPAARAQLFTEMDAWRADAVDEHRRGARRRLQEDHRRAGQAQPQARDDRPRLARGGGEGRLRAVVRRGEAADAAGHPGRRRGADGQGARAPPRREAHDPGDPHRARSPRTSTT